MSAASRARPGRWIGGGLLVAGALVAWYVNNKAGPERPPKLAPTRTPQTDAAPRAFAPTLEAGAHNMAPDVPLVIGRPWGSDDASLGRSRPKEGNPEAPM